jgi:hypothetical protein
MVAEPPSKTAARYGFRLVGPAPTTDPIVTAYYKTHLKDFGYPEDIVPIADFWMGIQRKDTIEGVFGCKRISEKILEIPDFYISKSRWGILAAYAALEFLRSWSDETGVQVLTGTPVLNTKMQKAMERCFGVKGPVLVVYRYPEFLR